MQLFVSEALMGVKMEEVAFLHDRKNSQTEVDGSLADDTPP